MQVKTHFNNKHKLQIVKISAITSKFFYEANQISLEFHLFINSQIKKV